MRIKCGLSTVTAGKKKENHHSRKKNIWWLLKSVFTECSSERLLQSMNILNVCNRQFSRATILKLLFLFIDENYTIHVFHMVQIVSTTINVYMHPCIWGYFNALLIEIQSLRINYQGKSTKSLKANENSFVLFDVGSMPFWVFSIGRERKVFVYLQEKKNKCIHVI